MPLFLVAPDCSLGICLSGCQQIEQSRYTFLGADSSAAVQPSAPPLGDVDMERDPGALVRTTTKGIKHEEALTWM